MKKILIILGGVLLLNLTYSYAGDVMKKQFLITVGDYSQINHIVIQEKSNFKQGKHLLTKEIGDLIIIKEIVAGINDYKYLGEYDLYCSYEVKFLNNNKILYSFDMFADLKTNDFIVLRSNDRHDFVIDNNVAKIILREINETNK